jgi:hypothetical protein
MKSVALGSAVALIMLTGLFVSHVEAKNDNSEEKGKNKIEAKNDKHDGKEQNKPDHPLVAQNYTQNATQSVPIPGTLLLMGGGFAGLVIWRALRKPQRNLRGVSQMRGK